MSSCYAGDQSNRTRPRDRPLLKPAEAYSSRHAVKERVLPYAVKLADPSNEIQ
jgi:hypothetical protein